MTLLGEPTRKEYVIWTGILLLLVASGVYTYKILVEGNWPIQPRDVTHPIGNSGGEFVQYDNGSPWFHKGIDIVVDKPWPSVSDNPADQPNDPWVVTMAQGTITVPNLESCGQSCELTLKLADANDTRVRYYHLDPNSIREDFEEGSVWPDGTKIGQVVQWAGCPKEHPNHDYYHHLHLEISGKSGQLEPVLKLFPNVENSSDPDLAALAGPFIEEIIITTNDSLGTPVRLDVGSGRPVLKGAVDIVVQAYDRQFATRTQSHITGILKIQYRLTETHGFPITVDRHGNAIPSGRMIDFSTIPANSSLAGIIYGDSGTVDSYSQFSCEYEKERYYYVVTNVADGDPTQFAKTNSWDTTQYANGLYMVWVTIWDTSGNIARSSKIVEINN